MFHCEPQLNRGVLRNSVQAVEVAVPVGVAGQLRRVKIHLVRSGRQLYGIPHVSSASEFQVDILVGKVLVGF